PDAERKKEDEISIDLARFEAELEASIARVDGKPRPATPTVGNDPPRSPFPTLDLDLADPVGSAAAPAPVAKPSPAPAPAAVAPPPRVTAPPAPLPGVASEPALPPLDLPAPAPIAPPPAPVAAPPGALKLPTNPSRAGFDLLAELRQAAAEKTIANDTDQAQRKARVERTESAMRSLFRDLGEFCGHLNKIQPALPQVFRPLPNIELAGLHWTESSLDYRTDGGTETSPLDSVALRYTLNAGDRIPVEKMPNYAAAYLDELKRVGLRFTASEKRGSRGLVESTVFTVDRAIVVTLLFKADSQQETIALQTRNFNGLGHASYRIKVSDLDQALLDQLGLHILGRPSKLFQRLIKE
ncbi:MAG TPA: hypothetical protein VFH22_03110, partial [Rhodocyclaceae bacterium]|nr:hypothetical protein [Rhodocyclaceae bacterium]